MSETTGGAQSEGHGTHAGGGPNVRRARRPQATLAVTNQPILPLDAGMLPNLTPYEAQQVALVQLQYARDVSQLAADSYQKVLDTVADATPPR